MPSDQAGSSIEPSKSLVSRLFAERRVYIRTANTTRYLVIRPGTQIAALGIIAIALGWTGFATVALVKHALDGRAANIQLTTVSDAYEARLAAHARQQTALEEQLNQADLRRDRITARLSAKQAQLVDTANSLREAEGELDVLRSEVAALSGQRQSNEARIVKLEAELAGLEVALNRAETDKSNMDNAFVGLTTAIDSVIAERDEASGKASVLDDELIRMHVKIGRYEDRQERLVSQLEEAARSSLGGLETLFGRIPVDLDSILAQAKSDFGGKGGPFEPAGNDIWADDTRIAALMNDLETVGLMRFATDRMPLGNPAPGARPTSGFGFRRDPHRRTRAMHNGYDLAAPRGTGIFATADGIVTFAGRQRGYGLIVKVRHAFGFETFYAHNSRLRVKVGQRVSRGDRIADMGSTGRSTGNHLHYEIRIGNKPVNPRKFIEAPRNVL